MIVLIIKRWSNVPKKNYPLFPPFVYDYFLTILMFFFIDKDSIMEISYCLVFNEENAYGQ